MITDSVSVVLLQGVKITTAMHENVNLSVSSLRQAIDELVRVSEGDLRKAITYLQSAARLNGEAEITEGTILEIAGVSAVNHHPGHH